ncbi:ABC transporter permease subunit [uncultured Roseobacter sp.]|uniref:ABC transporter permease subunit n=1 Tax=uncultured Roseobacter sp. TaxID=114847 RepID=UPI002612AF78|nr:ABC transporter permease subunit [uncultured Roseobacter sp.]
MMRILEKSSVLLPVVVILALLSMLGHGAYNHLADSDPLGLSYRGSVLETTLNTLVIVGSATTISAPIALLSSILFLETSTSSSDSGRSFARIMRRIMEVGASLPRLVWGVAGAVLFGSLFGLGVSAATGIAALACMMVPIMFNSFVDGLLSADRMYRPQLSALGIDANHAVRSVQFRAAMPALVASTIMAVGRGLGDAAVLLLTSGVSFVILSGLNESASPLAVQIYVLTMDIGGGRGEAMLAAVILLALTSIVQGLVLFIQPIDRHDRS